MKTPPPAECAQCGAPIPPRAHACPACGADERTGWRETSIYDGLELPDSAFADDDAPPRPRVPRRHINGIAWYWWCFAVAFIFVASLFVLSLL
ncbi:large ribosomal subunit protein bL32 [Horticoccus luteus]|uniref:large ribosomal subunit protein bL32 n=1 Tax=Horticoccus luteus TaxID=2862869 RepID=UPI002107B923|nr:zinc ribbon domain-containing protein [Horticoccus luteus]